MLKDFKFRTEKELKTFLAEIGVEIESRNSEGTFYSLYKLMWCRYGGIKFFKLPFLSILKLKLANFKVQSLQGMSKKRGLLCFEDLLFQFNGTRGVGFSTIENREGRVRLLGESGEEIVPSQCACVKRDLIFLMQDDSVKVYKLRGRNGFDVHVHFVKSFELPQKYSNEFATLKELEMDADMSKKGSVAIACEGLRNQNYLYLTQPGNLHGKNYFSLILFSDDFSAPLQDASRSFSVVNFNGETLYVRTKRSNTLLCFSPAFTYDQVTSLQAENVNERVDIQKITCEILESQFTDFLERPCQPGILVNRINNKIIDLSLPLLCENSSFEDPHLAELIEDARKLMKRKREREVDLYEITKEDIWDCLESMKEEIEEMVKNKTEDEVIFGSAKNFKAKYLSLKGNLNQKESLYSFFRECCMYIECYMSLEENLEDAFFGNSSISSLHQVLISHKRIINLHSEHFSILSPPIATRKRQTVVESFLVALDKEIASIVKKKYVENQFLLLNFPI